MKNISRLLSYLRGYRPQIVSYFITSLLAVVFSLASLTMLAPILKVIFSKGEGVLKSADESWVKSLVNDAVNSVLLNEGKEAALMYVCIAAVVFTLLKNLFLYLSMYILNPLRNSIINRLRDDMFTKTLSLPIGFFTEERKGDLVSRMTNDINEVEYSVVSVLQVFIREPLTIIFFLAMMVVISPQLTIFLFIFLPVAGLIIGRISKSLKKKSNLAQEQVGEIMGVIDETVAGMRVVKAFNAEKHQHNRFAKINDLLFNTRNKIAARRELASPMSETMGVLVVSIILWYGGRLVLNNVSGFEGEWFLVYIAFFTQIINPFKNLSSAFYNVQKGTAALDRIHSLLDAKNNITEAADAKPINDFKDSVELKDVHFSYGSKKVLQGINIKVEKGRSVALVGASGAGKSTIADLVPRFHDVESGQVLIDGVDVKDAKLFDIRKLMGIVSQDPILFNDTIYNNIALGAGSVSREQVEEAARIANAHNFIIQKADGYDTEVGDRGAKLSGGERQRITIARAVLKNPPILILDEATSSLDTESERIVQDAINSLMKNRTSIVIAHRLSTVQNADEIVVLDKGKVVERGTHETLIAQGGFYKKLVEVQQVR